MAKKTIIVDVSTAEFMLDFPQQITIKGVAMAGGKLKFDVETNLELPDVSTAIYENDEFGNSALVALE